MAPFGVVNTPHIFHIHLISIDHTLRLLSLCHLFEPRETPLGGKEGKKVGAADRDDCDADCERFAVAIGIGVGTDRGRSRE
jgi:hypothetical protein